MTNPTLIPSSVTHPVVAQANPHVHLFFFAPRGSAGKPVAHRKTKGRLDFVLKDIILRFVTDRLEGKLFTLSC